MALFEPVVSATDIANLRAAFRFFDADNSGEVSVEVAVAVEVAVVASIGMLSCLR
jgi:Ca2+-binding EF-hand superfamily protein